MGGIETGDIYSMVPAREKALFTLVLKKTEGNQVRAAHLPGINPLHAQGEDQGTGDQGAVQRRRGRVTWRQC